jgi:hypothetical protein
VGREDIPHRTTEGPPPPTTTTTMPCSPLGGGSHLPRSCSVHPQCSVRPFRLSTKMGPHTAMQATAQGTPSTRHAATCVPSMLPGSQCSGASKGLKPCGWVGGWGGQHARARGGLLCAYACEWGEAGLCALDIWDAYGFFQLPLQSSLSTLKGSKEDTRQALPPSNQTVIIDSNTTSPSPSHLPISDLPNHACPVRCHPVLQVVL